MAAKLPLADPSKSALALWWYRAALWLDRATLWWDRGEGKRRPSEKTLYHHDQSWLCVLL